MVLIKAEEELNFEQNQLVSAGEVGKVYYRTQNWELHQFISFVTFRITSYNCTGCGLNNSTQPRRGSGGLWSCIHQEGLLFCISHKGAFCLSRYVPTGTLETSLLFLIHIYQNFLETILRGTLEETYYVPDNHGTDHSGTPWGMILPEHYHDDLQCMFVNLDHIVPHSCVSMRNMGTPLENILLLEFYILEETLQWMVV